MKVVIGVVIGVGSMHDQPAPVDRAAREVRVFRRVAALAPAVLGPDGGRSRAWAFGRLVAAVGRERVHSAHRQGASPCAGASGLVEGRG